MEKPNTTIIITPAIKQFIKNALKEDIGKDDITTSAVIDKIKNIKGSFVLKEKTGIMAGLPIIKEVFALCGSNIKIDLQKKDGDLLKKGDIIADVFGSASTILKGERVALNFIQRLGGIATTTYRISKKIAPFGTLLLDTRKTTPGLRTLEKYAVLAGKGINHRIGLYDAYMIKENHIRAAGSLDLALKAIEKHNKSKKDVFVEVTNFSELETVLKYPVTRIMLDNFTPSDLKKIVIKAKKKYPNDCPPFEASGGINETNCDLYAESGVEYISMGAITQSIKSLDISFLFNFV